MQRVTSMGAHNPQPYIYWYTWYFKNKTIPKTIIIGYMLNMYIRAHKVHVQSYCLFICRIRLNPALFFWPAVTFRHRFYGNSTWFNRSSRVIEVKTMTWRPVINEWSSQLKVWNFKSNCSVSTSVNATWINRIIRKSNSIEHNDVIGFDCTRQSNEIEC